MGSVNWDRLDTARICQGRQSFGFRVRVLRIVSDRGEVAKGWRVVCVVAEINQL